MIFWSGLKHCLVKTLDLMQCVPKFEVLTLLLCVAVCGLHSSLHIDAVLVQLPLVCHFVLVSFTIDFN